MSRIQSAIQCVAPTLFRFQPAPLTLSYFHTMSHTYITSQPPLSRPHCTVRLLHHSSKATLSATSQLARRCHRLLSTSTLSFSVSPSLVFSAMSDQFSQLAAHTVIVADTGDLEQIKKYKPTDATTNPSLLYAAVQDPSYDHLVDEAIAWSETRKGPRLENILDRLSVNVGAEITKLVPGLVSTELDSRLSFDTEGSVVKARAIIESYADKVHHTLTQPHTYTHTHTAATKEAAAPAGRNPPRQRLPPQRLGGPLPHQPSFIPPPNLHPLLLLRAHTDTPSTRTSSHARTSHSCPFTCLCVHRGQGVGRERILIKLASTWEGLQAAKVLEAEGIHVNMTLLFSKAQAIVAANVGATLVSPFVGRILDWYAANTDKKTYTADEDPGVASVTEIYNYFKATGSSTVVMGASFRNKGEILALAGCDKLTIAPKLLEELKHSNEPLKVRLSADSVPKGSQERIELSEKDFRWMMNENQMATEKLAEGIRKFAADTNKLEDIINKKLKGQLNNKQ